MKLTIPGIVLTALIAASPAAFAQNTGYSGTTSKPGASVAKDDQTNVTKPSKSKKHMASYKQRHHAKRVSHKSETTGSASSSSRGAGTSKDETMPKSR